MREKRHMRSNSFLSSCLGTFTFCIPKPELRYEGESLFFTQHVAEILFLNNNKIYYNFHKGVF